jgi:hypothetical protein
MRVVLSAALIVAGTACGTASADVPANPTYTKDVAPILFENCTGCHRAGQVGPMSLLTYQEVRPWAKSIGKNVADGAMPPWDADHGYGPWIEDRSMSKDEIATIVNWVNAGAPQGNPKDLPASPIYSTNEWSLGDPDLVVTFDNFDVPGGGPDLFHDHIVQTPLKEDKWITDIEILPGASEVVHHVILWKGQQGGGNPQGWVGAWAAGATPMQFPDGVGRKLEEGSTLRGDMHYHPADEDFSDSTRVGFHFADGDVEKELVNLWVMNAEFVIPPGADNHEVKSRYTFGEDSHLISLTPHMHYRGKDFVYTASYPDGTSKELLKVSKYDFAWQTEYRFEDPESMPKGTRIDCVAHFDNSEGNAANPDPSKTLTFGTDSYDEMMIGFIDYIVDDGMSPKAIADPIEQKIADLVDMHSGFVYSLKVPLDASKGMQKTAIVMPREGDGGWYIPLGAIAVRAAITDITWSGNDFTATLTIPGQGTQDLKGSVNPAAGEITVIMRGFPLKGVLEQ